MSSTCTTPRIRAYVSCIALAVACMASADGAEWRAADGRVSDAPDSRTRALASRGPNLPLSFEKNQGQAPGLVRFVARGPAFMLSFSPAEVLFQFMTHHRGAQPKTLSAAAARTYRQSLLSLTFPGANLQPQLESAGDSFAKVHYLVGDTPQRWQTNITTHSKIRYRQLYPGVDLVFYGRDGQLEFDFEISPGTDPRLVRLRFEGAESIELGSTGELIVHLADGQLIQHAPFIYQSDGEFHRQVPGRFVLADVAEEHKLPTVGFEVAAYDPNRPLVIDPVLSYSSYLGGSDGDFGYAIALDPNGNIYVAGKTFSTNFPNASARQPLNQNDQPGYMDAYVAKLTRNGSALVYATYLGSNRDEEARGIAVDAEGNAYVTGYTTSGSFPVRNALQSANAGGTSDAFVTKLGPTGCAIVYSTYLGGSSIDQGNGIAVDDAGNIFVAGFTVSSSFPTTNAFQPARGGFFGRDAFVCKINPAGSAFVYSTYLGGSGFDQAFDIAVDRDGNACVTGSTDSSFDFPVWPVTPLRPFGGLTDAFVTKFNASGAALIYSSYLGGSDTDLGTGIAADADGNVYVTGNAVSTNFPTANALQSTNAGGYDAFVAKINPDGSALVYSTYLGGSDDENVSTLVAALGAVAVDADGNAYVAGSTASLNFPQVAAVQTKFGGGQSDAFIAKLNSRGTAFEYSTYLGGSGEDIGWGITVDSSGRAYVAGQTISIDFPTANALMPGPQLGTDTFIARLGDGTTPPASLSTVSWTPFGPAPLLRGQAPGCPPVSGRTVGVAAHPSDPNIIYIATAGGGVWKTTNAGLSWRPLTDSQPTLSMGAIALAPSNPEILYVGTGEFTGFNQPPFANPFFGRGILKSTDGGTSWTLLGNAHFDRRTITKIAVHPADPNVLYVAVAPGELHGLTNNTGIWKSTDGGATWANTTANLSTTDPFSDLAMEPSNPQNLYAAVGSPRGRPANGIYKTVNGGATWAAAGNFPTGTGLGDIKLAIAPSAVQTLYAAIVSPGYNTNLFNFRSMFFTPGLYKMFKTVDGGSTWTELAGVPNYVFRQGFFNHTLIVDPADPQIVYAGGTAGPNGFLATTNGGLNWFDITSGVDGVGIHGDAQGVGFDANGKLLLGDDGGVWRLDNPTISKILWKTLNSNLDTIQFYAIALHPTDPEIAYGGTQDNGTAKYSGDSAWVRIASGDGGFVRVDPSNSYTVYHESYGLSLTRSDDGGTTSLPKLNGLYNDDSNFLVPYVLDPDMPQRLLMGTDSVYETLDRAESWELLSIPFFNGWDTTAVIDSIGLVPGNPRIIYASAGGHFFATFDYADNWLHRDIPGVSENIQDIKVDPRDPQTVYAVRARMEGSHVFCTANGGQTWLDISGNLPDLPVYAIELDVRFSPPVLYIATHDGVYASANLGAAWSRVGQGLPRTIVFDIELNVDLGILAAGTHGRGMWQLALPTPAPALAIQPDAANAVVLAWPATASAFALEAASPLPPAGSWSPVTNTPVVFGNQRTVTLPTAGQTRFFRLRAQD